MDQCCQRTRAAERLTTPPTDVSPWGGAITFHTGSPWTYDNGGTPGDNFYAVAQHELGHLLGIGEDPTPGNTTVWESLISDGKFTGAKSIDEFGGPVPVSICTGAHFDNSVTSEGRRVTMAQFFDGTNPRCHRLRRCRLSGLGMDVAGSQQHPTSAERHSRNCRSTERRRRNRGDSTRVAASPY